MPSTVPDTVESLLTAEPLVAHLATSLNDRPHSAPVRFHYDDGVVDIVTSGKKLDNVRRNPRVALSVHADERGHTEWAVSLLGTAELIDDEDAFTAANRRINEKYDADEDAYTDNTLVRISVGSVNHTIY